MRTSNKINLFVGEFKSLASPSEMSHDVTDLKTYTDTMQWNMTCDKAKHLRIKKSHVYALTVFIAEACAKKVWLDLDLHPLS